MPLTQQKHYTVGYHDTELHHFEICEYAAEIQMGKDGMLVFAPCELTINVEDTVTFVNNELPPHNVMFADNPELSHGDLLFSAGETFEVTFHQAGDYAFQCDPHAGAGMKGVIHVQ